MRIIFGALLLLLLVGCHELTVDDVADACTERAGAAYRADCVDYAESYADCLEEALALVEEPTDANREELRACAH